MGEDMDYDQYRTLIERHAITYAFNQVDGGVPIEFAGIQTRLWDLQNPDTVHGTVFKRYAKRNQVTITPANAPTAAGVALGQLIGSAGQVVSTVPSDGIQLVLLPYGTDAAGMANMRYAYRLTITARWRGQTGQFLLWLDADNGTLLKVDPLFGDAVAIGTSYNRDPGLGGSGVIFTVDAASGGAFTLQRAGVANRVDFQGDGFNGSDVSTTSSFFGIANFNAVSGITNVDQSTCGSGTNKGLQQVNYFATMNRSPDDAVSLGIFTPFPASAFSPRVESASAGCNAWSSMDFRRVSGLHGPSLPQLHDQQHLGCKLHELRP